MTNLHTLFLWRMQPLNKRRKLPKFHLISWCENFVESHSFCRFLSLSLIEFAGLKFRNFIKKRQVLSCEICNIFKNTYFEERLLTTASERSSAKCVD